MEEVFQYKAKLGNSYLEQAYNETLRIYLLLCEFQLENESYLMQLENEYLASTHNVDLYKIYKIFEQIKTETINMQRLSNELEFLTGLLK